MDDTAIRIVNAIITDICCRKGIGDAWDVIDNDTKESIIDNWHILINEELFGDDHDG
jgi:hypothetical protein